MKISKLSDTSLKIFIAAVLILFAIAGRLMPHPDNFAPIAAIALLGGAVLPRKWALSLPLAAMVLSDLVIGIHPLIYATWGSFILIAYAAHRWLKHIRPSHVIIASLGASVFFFIVTNFAVWLQGSMYSMDLAGLAQCYRNALPFFRNTLLGDLVYSGLFFGTYALVYTVARERLGFVRDAAKV